MIARSSNDLSAFEAVTASIVGRLARCAKISGRCDGASAAIVHRSRVLRRSPLVPVASGRRAPAPPDRCRAEGSATSVAAEVLDGGVAGTLDD